jgi:hypothetical protein
MPLDRVPYTRAAIYDASSDVTETAELVRMEPNGSVCVGQSLSAAFAVLKCGCECILLNMAGKDTTTSAKSFYTVKRTRKSVSLEIKHRIIHLADGGESNTEIARKLKLPRTTVVTILKDKARILETIKCQTPMQTRYIPRQGKRDCVKDLRMAYNGVQNIQPNMYCDKLICF